MRISEAAKNSNRNFSHHSSLDLWLEYFLCYILLFNLSRGNRKCCLGHLSIVIVAWNEILKCPPSLHLNRSLWTLLFLICYCMKPANDSVWKCNEKTFLKHKWITVETIASVHEVCPAHWIDFFVNLFSLFYISNHYFLTEGTEMWSLICQLKHASETYLSVYGTEYDIQKTRPDYF